MQKIEPKKISSYWQKTAEHDYETMCGLFKIKRHSEALFFGHIVLEKILKALVVNKTEKHAPYTHDLVKLLSISEIKLSKEDVDFLDEMNNYNLQTRYPDYKLGIYKLCTKEFTKKRIDRLKKIYMLLCDQVK